MKIVINRRFGGFGISDAAGDRLVELGMRSCGYDEKGEMQDESADLIDMRKTAKKDKSPMVEPLERLRRGDHYSFRDRDVKSLRTDPRLVQVVEELGDAANGSFAQLEIVDVPDDVDWYIHDYDGVETVNEMHRSWP